MTERKNRKRHACSSVHTGLYTHLHTLGATDRLKADAAAATVLSVASVHIFLCFNMRSVYLCVCVRLCEDQEEHTIELPLLLLLL